MVRRWLIRSAVIGLCVVYLGAWVGSHYRFASIRHFAGGRAQVLMLDGGKIVFSTYSGLSVPPSSPALLTWYWEQGAHDIDWYQEPYRGGKKYRFLGFAYAYGVKPSAYDWQAFIPLWFLAFPVALIFLIAWRRTKSVKAGLAFPIEPGGKPQRKSGVSNDRIGAKSYRSECDGPIEFARWAGEDDSRASS